MDSRLTILFTEKPSKKSLMPIRFSVTRSSDSSTIDLESIRARLLLAAIRSVGGAAPSLGPVLLETVLSEVTLLELEAIRLAVDRSVHSKATTSATCLEAVLVPTST